MLEPAKFSKPRYDWTVDEVLEILSAPFMDLVYAAATVHRMHFDPDEVQVSSLLSIKTGACPEDCKYCPQSAWYKTGLIKESLLAYDTIMEKARIAKSHGATRFCMGAAWRNPKERDMAFILQVIRGVKSLGLETCMTLGMLTNEQAAELAGAGLDYYNHNLDTSPEFYSQIITTRTYEDRLETLRYVRDAGIKICCGGILGMGETRRDRASFLRQVAMIKPHPESVPINLLVKVKGTPLEKAPDLDPFEFIRVVATARLLFPESYVRMSAGREEMSEEMQALCFLAGANSIFYGARLLTTHNSGENRDIGIFEKLGLNRNEKLTESDTDDLHFIFEKVHENAHRDNPEHRGCARLDQM